jgi:hypothetical protein
MVKLDRIPECKFINDGMYECRMSEFMIIFMKRCTTNLFNYLHNPANWMKLRYKDDFDKEKLNDPNIIHIDKIKLILSNSNFIEYEFIDGYIEDGMINDDGNTNKYIGYFYDACISGIFDLKAFIIAKNGLDFFN